MNFISKAYFRYRLFQKERKIAKQADAYMAHLRVTTNLSERNIRRHVRSKFKATYGKIDLLKHALSS